MNLTKKMEMGIQIGLAFSGNGLGVMKGVRLFLDSIIPHQYQFLGKSPLFLSRCIPYTALGTAVPKPVYIIHCSSVHHTLLRRLLYTALGTAVPKQMYTVHYSGAYHTLLRCTPYTALGIVAIIPVYNLKPNKIK